MTVVVDVREFVFEYLFNPIRFPRCTLPLVLFLRTPIAVEVVAYLLFRQTEVEAEGLGPSTDTSTALFQEHIP